MFNHSFTWHLREVIQINEVQSACLNDDMDQVKVEGEDLPWLDLVKRCYSRGVDLTGHHQGHSIVDGLANYVIMAAAVTEVEIDVLTGMHQIRRCDFIEDTGFSTYSNFE